jgi:hypothetical protein
MWRLSTGAEGVAQLVPQYYSSGARSDPQEALVADAETW